MNRGNITPRPQNATSYLNPQAYARSGNSQGVSGPGATSPAAYFVAALAGWPYKPLPTALDQTRTVLLAAAML